MKTKRTRVALLVSLCLLIASLVTVLIVSAEENTGVLTVSYANGVTETYAEGDTIVPIEVPDDFARYDETGNAYVYTVNEGAAWSFVLDGKALTEMTVSRSMLGKTAYADVPGTMGTEKVFFTVHEQIVDETVPADKRGEFFIYGYDEASLIQYLSRDNVGEDPLNPRYRYLRQRDNVFHITLYADLYPTKFDPRWGASAKDWALEYEGVTYMVQDRTWRGDKFESDGVTPKPVGDSAKVYFNLNGHTLEIGASESFHFGSMACTPYSMRLYFYSTTPGAVFSGAKSEAVFYSDDDSAVYVGELESGDTKYGQNLSVYGKMVAHVNYGGGVRLWGGRYYQVGANHAFINISHRLYEAKNCEFYLADQSEAVLFFNNGQMTNWSATKSGLKFENCTFYVNQHGTQLLREVSSRTNAGAEMLPVPIEDKYTLRFVDCSFYGIPTANIGYYLTMKYDGDTAYSVGTSENVGTVSAPKYISYLANPTKTATLYDSTGAPFTVTAACAPLPASSVACVQYQTNKTYWQPGASPFVYDKVVMTATERYVESEGRYLGLPSTLEAGNTYTASGVVYGKKTVVAFIYTLESGIEGYGLAGENEAQTGNIFASKVGSLSSAKITLLADMTLTQNVDFGTRGEIFLDMNGYKITVAENARMPGAVHRIGDGMEVTFYSSRPGSVYENLSSAPIFSLSHGGKGGVVSIGDFERSVNDVYSGTNVTYISQGSFFVGYAMGADIDASAHFKAKNVDLLYTGSGAALLFAHEGSLDNVRISFAPTDAEATPVAIATRANTAASIGCSSCSFYAPENVSAAIYACLDEQGAPVSAAAVEQSVRFNNTAFYHVEGSIRSNVENVAMSFNGHTAFLTLDDLKNFYDGQFPLEQTLVHSSAEFYINGAKKRIPLWVSAAPGNVATVTFSSGAAGLGSFTEEWVIGSIACHEDFVVNGIFVYTYGRREVASNSNVLTAGCNNLVPGTMRVNLGWMSGLKLNLWIPKDTPITSVSVNGVKTEILSTLDYKGDYYLVQAAITPAMLSQRISLVIRTEEGAETLQLRLENYVSKLLRSHDVTAEEKQALYALVKVSEQITGSSMGLLAPVGYGDQVVIGEEGPTVGGSVTGIAYDIMSYGTALNVSGVSGTEITLITADGSRFEGRIENGVCRFENVPVYLLLDAVTVQCGEDTYSYSVAAYKQSLSEVLQKRADVLYTYFYYVNKLYTASLGA